jgi:hypothetical protein
MFGSVCLEPLGIKRDSVAKISALALRPGLYKEV